MYYMGHSRKEFRILIVFLFGTLLRYVFTDRIEPDWTMIILKQQRTWVETVTDCHTIHNGTLLGARDPVFQNEEVIKSLIGNRTVWTGSYKRNLPNRTPWMSFKGCYDVSTFRYYTVKKMNITRVFDCYSVCMESRRNFRGIGMNIDYCFCFEYSSWQGMGKLVMGLCSVDVDGNLYGNSNDSSAFYEMYTIPRIQQFPYCLTGNYCSVSLEHCYSTLSNGLRNYACNDRSTVRSKGWIDAQRKCVEKHSFLYPHKKSGGCHNHRYKYFRIYEEIKDLEYGTSYNYFEMQACQTVRYNKGLVADFSRCSDGVYYKTPKFAGLCKYYINPTEATTQTTSMASFEASQKPGTPAPSTKVAPSKKYPSESRTMTDKSNRHGVYITSDSTTHNRTTTVGGPDEQMAAETAKETNSIKLAVAISVPVVAVTVVILLLCIRYWNAHRRKKKQDNSWKNIAAVNEAYEMPTSTNVPSHNTSEQCIAGPQVSGNDNFHDDDHNVSENDVYDHLHTHRQHREDQHNEYGYVSRSEHIDDIYTYDKTHVTEHAQVYSENVYNIATANVTGETEGAYDLSNHGNQDQGDSNGGTYETFQVSR